MFITFEGIDGCGKTTQIQLLADYLKAKKVDCVLTREPGGTNIGTRIREVLLDKNQTNLAHLTEIFLFSADRAQHVEEIIRPSLKAGKVVLCDRYIDSTRAYQIGGRQLDKNMIEQLIATTINGLVPNKTILFDLVPETALRRATRIHGSDRFESEKTAFYDRTRNYYLKLAIDNPDRFIKIDAQTKSIEDIRVQLKTIMDKYF